MLSRLFGKKKDKTTTVVDSAVEDTLHAAQGFASAPPAARSLAGIVVREVAVDVTTTPLTIVPEAVRTRTTTGYVVERPGQVPLMFVAGSGDMPKIELWELSDGGTPVPQRQLPLKLDREQASWALSGLFDVAALPEGKVLLGVVYHAPHVQEAIYVYDLAGGASSAIGRVAIHPRQLDQVFETQTLSDDAVLVLYYTGRVRKRAEVYYNDYNHFLLFSSRYPRGLEVLRLGVHDGNVKRWAVIDGTLWLHTEDPRDDAHKESFWSLDLSKVM